MTSKEEFLKRFKEAQEKQKIKMQEDLASVPAIHWEILQYANDHTKQETLDKYPENAEFIERIIWNN